VSFRRRAAAPRLIEWTGERCVPWAPDVQVVYEHYHRYLWAAHVVGGRRVLDLGSGEGFGAVILAESADHVVGLDVDELTVEHSRLNYASENLEFEVGTALDLSRHADGFFGAVVAFEIIEHVSEQERVLQEVARVLGTDGVLLISTPERRMYEEARSEPNPFHMRELNLAEFLQLLGTRFPHVASWGQRTIAGSHLGALGDSETEAGAAAPSDFFIERAGDEWRRAGTPAGLYCVALASQAPLPSLARSSTLADCGLELVREKEREAAVALTLNEDLSRSLDRTREHLERERDDLSVRLEHERVEHAHALRERDARTHEEREQRDRDIAQVQEAVVRREQALVAMRELLPALESELAVARQANRRTEESVTWQAFQKMRGRLYGAIGGEQSMLARVLGVWLRLAGRLLVTRRALPAAAASPGLDAPELIEMPEYDRPRVSLIIPLHARADLTRACLNSIRDHTTDAPYEVILVDDSADPETKRLLEGVRGATVLCNETNLGYLRSVNRGGAIARGEWLVLFNNDTEVTKDWLHAMLNCATSGPDVGVVTPKYVYPDGSLNEAGGIIWRDGTGANYGRGDRPDRCRYEYRRETDYGSAAALMVSADLWRAAGGFDERYLPMYYEDTDLCFQARERGLRVLYEPEAVIVHVEGATAGADPQKGHKRYQELNRRKFVAKWRSSLETSHRHPAPANLRVAANRQWDRHVLVVDHRVPMWDRDSGSLRVLGMMQAMIDLGIRVTFLPDNLGQTQPYTRRLQRLGIEVLYGGVDVHAELATLGPTLNAAVLCRPNVASHWLDTVRQHAPTATIVYDTVDLHWLREVRRHATAANSSAHLAEDNGNMELDSIPPRAKSLRELELAMIRASDVTLVVSEVERSLVQRDVRDARVVVVPNVHRVEAYVRSPESRSGILFVGGFEHVPNVDAAIRLVRDVMPPIWRELGEVRVTIVGCNPPPEVEALASPLVEVTGWVEDVQPLISRARVMLAPLRYGAGLKGKVTQCLAAGLPVVTTPIGAEGLEDCADCILLADTAAELAAQAVRLYRDDALWGGVSRAGQSLISQQCSPDVVVDRLRAVLSSDRSSWAHGATTSVRSDLDMPHVAAQDGSN
jgi:O-antigen biosynthesis protein